MSSETTLTMATMTRESMSCRRAQSGVKLPTEIQAATCRGTAGVPEWTRAAKDATPAMAEMTMNRMLAPIESCLPRKGRATPARMEPIRGAKTAINVNISTLHQCHVLDLDRATVAEIDDQDGKADGGFRRGHGKHEHGEDLAHHVVQRA